MGKLSKELCGGTHLLDRATDIKGSRVLANVMDMADAKTLRDLGDKLRDRLRSGIILLGSKGNGKAMLLCLVTNDLTDRYHAGKIVK